MQTLKGTRKEETPGTRNKTRIDAMGCNKDTAEWLTRARPVWPTFMASRLLDVDVKNDAHYTPRVNVTHGRMTDEPTSLVGSNAYIEINLAAEVAFLIIQ